MDGMVRGIKDQHGIDFIRQERPEHVIFGYGLKRYPLNCWRMWTNSTSPTTPISCVRREACVKNTYLPSQQVIAHLL